MTIIYDELKWQAQKVGNSEVESVCDTSFATDFEFDEGVFNESAKPITLNPTTIIKETHHIRGGFRLVREQTYTSVPLHYLPFERTDYVGVCFVFAADDIDSKDLAFRQIYHNNLNITNGFEYKAETLTAIRKPLHYVSLQFDSAFIESLNEQQSVPNWLLRLASNKDGQILDQISTPPTLRQLAWQISQMPTTHRFSDSLRMESKAVDWLAGIIETNANPTAASIFDAELTNVCKNFVVQACDIIHSEYSQPLTINELAVRVGTNTSYLKQYFKHHTGHSIHEYLTQYRLKQAQTMLIQQPNLKIQIIAGLCGYQAGHFSQLFKDTYGLSPSQYRVAGLSGQ